MGVSGIGRHIARLLFTVGLSAFVLALTGPDLITNLKVPDQLGGGQWYSITIATRNVGDSFANNSTTRLEISENGSTTFRHFSIAGLWANGSAYSYYNYTCIPGTNYTVTFTSVADYYNTVNESNENNNDRTKNMSCIS